MSKYNALDSLHHLFGTYVDIELENFKLQAELLAQGLTVSDLKPLTKSPKLINLLKANFNLKEQQIIYYKSYEFQYSGKHSLSQIRKPKISLFSDDLWEVTLTHPQELKVSSFYSGEYLFDTLRQGVAGLIPKLVKERTGKSIGQDNFKNLNYNLEIKLCINHEQYKESNRGRMENQVDFLTSDSEVFKKLNPATLFHPIIHYHNDSKFDLFKERLKLWNIQYHGNLYKATSEELIQFVKNLPINDFGVKQINILTKIEQHFHDNISNEVLLTGEIGSNVFDRRHLEGFNRKLKNLLKT